MKLYSILLCAITVVCTTMPSNRHKGHTSQARPVAAVESIGITVDVAMELIEKLIPLDQRNRLTIQRELGKLSSQDRLGEVGKYATVVSTINKATTVAAVQQAYKSYSGLPALRAVVATQVNSVTERIQRQEVTSQQIRKNEATMIFGSMVDDQGVRTFVQELKAAVKQISLNKQSSIEVELGKPAVVADIVNQMKGQWGSVQLEDLKSAFLYFIRQIRDNEKNAAELERIYTGFKSRVAAVPALARIAQEYFNRYLIKSR